MRDMPVYLEHVQAVTSLSCRYRRRDTVACRADCRVAICGDGIVEPGEECDLGVLDGGETCDDGNTVGIGMGVPPIAAAWPDDDDTNDGSHFRPIC